MHLFLLFDPSAQAPVQLDGAPLWQVPNVWSPPRQKIPLETLHFHVSLGVEQTRGLLVTNANGGQPVNSPCGPFQVSRREHAACSIETQLYPEFFCALKAPLAIEARFVSNVECSPTGFSKDSTWVDTLCVQQNDPFQNAPFLRSEEHPNLGDAELQPQPFPIICWQHGFDGLGDSL
jgi:hypothetical protein